MQDHIHIESSVLQFWQDNNIFQKSLDKNKNCPAKIFYDGPPFATGTPHHGHIVASLIKDIFPRYLSMKGFLVNRRWGWDCHGLPIEQEIDKKFNCSARDYVAEHGIRDYNNQCRGIVQKFTAEWKSTINRFGRWVDFENDYKTMDPDFMESVWWTFGQLFEKGLVYQGNKVVPYSTKLETGLSNFEANSNMKEIDRQTVTVLFKSNKFDDTYFAVWTTTPWTLPANLALCINRNFTYGRCKLKDQNKYIIIAQNLITNYEKYIEGDPEWISADELIGSGYEQLLVGPDAKLADQGYFTVLADDYVTNTSGTGIVHLAPAFGEDDLRVMREHGLTESYDHLNPSGRLVAGGFAGQHYAEASKAITKMLNNIGLILEVKNQKANVAHCPRTDLPLIDRAIPQWYVKVESIRDKLLAANDQTNWVPAHVKEGRFGSWLKNARDWAVSRDRYWGTPIPLWVNDVTGKVICISSREELKKYSRVSVTDIHRENVDNITFILKEESEGIYRRVDSVFDCWFESGAMPYAQLHYPFENKELFEKVFPAEFIAEGLDQTRGWFYTLTVLAAALFDGPAFKNVVVNGMVLAADGKKMSKRLKNYSPPEEVLDTYGADALRLYLAHSGVVHGEEVKFNDSEISEMNKRILLPFRNALNFFKTYADIIDYKHNICVSNNEFDQWILSKTNSLVEYISSNLDQYKLSGIVNRVTTFFDDLNNWYIRMNRKRFTGDDSQDALATLLVVLRTVSLVLAPIIPFHTEYVYGELKKYDDSLAESVHLENYPETFPTILSEQKMSAFDTMQKIIVMTRAARAKTNIKVKIPLANLDIVLENKSLENEVKNLLDYIKSETNVLNINFLENNNDLIKWSIKLNDKKLSAVFGKEYQSFRNKVLNLSAEQLNELNTNGSITVEETHLKKDDDITLQIVGQQAKGIFIENDISIRLDVNLTSELIEEGVAREIIGIIQRARKNAGCKLGEQVIVNIFIPAKYKEIMQRKNVEESIMTSINFLDSYEADFHMEKIDNEVCWIKVIK